MKELLYVLFSLALLPAYAQNRKFPYSNGKKWGLTNENKEVLIAPQYDTAFWFYKDLFAVVQKNKLYGTIAPDGKLLLPCKYEALSAITDEMGMAKLQGKFRLVSLSTGKELSQVLFDQLQNYKYTAPRILHITTAGKHYFLNTSTGRLVNQKGFDEAGFVTGDHYQGMVQSGGQYGVIDLKTGNVIVPVKYDHLVYKNGGEIEAISGDNITIYAADGSSRPGNNNSLTATEGPMFAETARANEEESPYSPTLDLYIYPTGDKSWKVTYEKRTRKDVPGEALSTVYELKGYTSVKKFLTSHPYSQIKALLKVTNNGKAGLVTLDGREVLPCIYDDIENKEDFYKTIRDGKEGLITTDMKELKPPVLKHIFLGDYTIGAWFIEMPDGKKGFMDMSNGDIFIPGVELSTK